MIAHARKVHICRADLIASHDTSVRPHAASAKCEWQARARQQKTAAKSPPWDLSAQYRLNSPHGCKPDARAPIQSRPFQSIRTVPLRRPLLCHSPEPPAASGRVHSGGTPRDGACEREKVAAHEREEAADDEDEGELQHDAPQPLLAIVVRAVAADHAAQQLAHQAGHRLRTKGAKNVTACKSHRMQRKLCHPHECG
eukprot:6214141-Pleurochrysis_carterae.AAC.6